jgi:predicted RNA-binding Zn ribbon-like protein
MSETTETDSDLQAENELLKARVSALEAELVEVQTKANAAVARWQERAYWLDRWHLDLNALMRRPGAAELRSLLRGVREVKRTYVRARRRLSER